MALLGYDKDRDGNDDPLTVMTNDDYSVFWLNGKVPFLAGGRRQGTEYDEEHPFVGTWVYAGGEFQEEVRLVEPADYPYYLELPEIPMFAIRQGKYLLKQTGPNTFESDSAFSDGFIRITVRGADFLVLTPLFSLPEENGFVEPLFMRRARRQPDEPDDHREESTTSP
jgi:hypothetical protein